jgi:pyrroloquinoline quinone (PQQ) biosynthesis protein C
MSATSIAEFEHLMDSHPVCSHSFWAQFEKGSFTLEQVKPFALQYYLHVSTTRLYAAAVLSRMPDERIQLAIASVLWDEYGHGDPEQTHPAQFRRFLGQLGLTEPDWARARPIPELSLYRDLHQSLCSQESIWLGMGIVAFAMEWPIPKFYRYLVAGFRRALRLDDQALAFFLDHVKEDEAHADILASALRPYLADQAICRSIREGINRSLDARSELMSGLQKIMWPPSG